MKETTSQRADETPREEPASKRRGLLPRVPVLTAILFAGAIALSAIAGAALASVFLDRTPEDTPVAEAEIQAPGEGSPEVGFARDMMVHHAQAVEMAEIVRDETESQEIRNLAADIALTQQGQIGQMQGWLQVWGLPVTGKDPAMAWMGHPTEGRMPGMASPEEIDELQKASAEEADVQFLQLMIPHHRAAVPMAEAVLEQSDRPEVNQLATAVAASQEAEIRMMQNLLQRRGVSVEEDSQTHGGGPHGGE